MTATALSAFQEVCSSPAVLVLLHAGQTTLRFASSDLLLLDELLAVQSPASVVVEGEDLAACLFPAGEDWPGCFAGRILGISPIERALSSSDQAHASFLESRRVQLELADPGAELLGSLGTQPITAQVLLLTTEPLSPAILVFSGEVAQREWSDGTLLLEVGDGFDMLFEELTGTCTHRRLNALRDEPEPERMLPIIYGNLSGPQGGLELAPLHRVGREEPLRNHLWAVAGHRVVSVTAVFYRQALTGRFRRLPRADYAVQFREGGPLGHTVLSFEQHSAGYILPDGTALHEYQGPLRVNVVGKPRLDGEQLRVMDNPLEVLDDFLQHHTKLGEVISPSEVAGRSTFFWRSGEAVRAALAELGIRAAGAITSPDRPSDLVRSWARSWQMRLYPVWPAWQAEATPPLAQAIEVSLAFLPLPRRYEHDQPEPAFSYRAEDLHWRMDEVMHLLEGSLHVSHDQQQHATEVAYRWQSGQEQGRSPSQGGVLVHREISHPQPSGELHGSRRRELKLGWLRDQAAARTLAALYLWRYHRPRALLRVEAPLFTALYEVGSVVLIEAPPWSPARRGLLLRSEIDLTSFTCTMEFLDVEGLWQDHGLAYEQGLRLGDETGLDPEWSEADSEDREYGYLCDEQDCRFSTDEPGKTLWRSGW